MKICIALLSVVLLSSCGSKPPQVDGTKDATKPKPCANGQCPVRETPAPASTIVPQIYK